MKQPIHSGLTFLENLRFVVEIEIARTKIIKLESAVFQSYPANIAKTIPAISSSLLSIKNCLENKYLEAFSHLKREERRGLYSIGLGYKIAKQLDLNIIDSSRLDLHGLVRKSGNKKNGMSIQEHNRAGLMLQSLHDLFHHYQVMQWGAYWPDKEPAALCMDRCQDIEYLQGKMSKLLKKEYPSLPAAEIEHIYLIKTNSEYVYLANTFTCLTKFAGLINRELREMLPGEQEAIA